jgi:pimeloyl-ACP methyl ester carboxylesterase
MQIASNEAPMWVSDIFGLIKPVAAAVIGALAFVGYAPSPAAPLTYHGDPSVRGSVAEVTPVGAYSALHMRALLWLAKLPVTASTGARLYRVSYWSVTDGKPVLVSGLMGVPDRDPPRGTVVWMHGTHDSRTDSMTNPKSQEGMLVSVVFAGGDYLLLAPDLVGLGVSKDPQAYFYNPSTIDVTEDFLRAAQTVTKDLRRTWNPNLYLTGFSQGGHSAAILQRELEQHPNPAWRVKASAGVAGPYNLADISLPYAMNGHSPEDSAYLSTLALSYSTYYHQPLESVLTKPYAGTVERLFDGDHGVDEIQKAMPSNPRALFTPAFLAAFDAKAPNWFSSAWRDNQANAWAPKAPFRAYYGDNDVDVSPQDAKTFVAQAKSLGGDAEAISVGPYDHGGSALQAAPRIRQWFDTLSDGAGSR